MMLLKRFTKDRMLIFLLITALLVRLFSINEVWVERYYSNGVYPYISLALRSLLGWIPFSIGDLLYFGAGLYLLLAVIKGVRRIRNKQAGRHYWRRILKHVVKLALWVYLFFNVLWGLNYNRQGIGHQLQLTVEPYNTEDVFQLTTLLQQRLNVAATKVTEGHRRELESNTAIHQMGIQSFEQASTQLPYLRYNKPSIKSSLYTYVGQFVGFTGYYNPFSGEAQLKTTVPRFLQPFIMNHEIAHQVGYAKENEANFVAYLTGSHASESTVQYATYFEVYLYAVRDLARRDTTLAKSFKTALHPQAQQDLIALVNYLKKEENPIEPFFSRFYDQFLKMNRQPKGTRTYNEVVAWMIAYMKKYGSSAI